MAQVYGQWPLNVCQMGQETTKGQAIAATTVWRGPLGAFEDDRKIEEVEEDIGTFARIGLQFITQDGAKVAFPQTALNILQLPHVLQASIGVATPTGTGPYVRQYDAAISDTDPAIKTYTLRVGNKRINQDVTQIAYAMAQEWEMSGKQGELWKLSSTWTAPRRAPSTFTANVAIPAFDPVIFAKTLLYIDNSGGTIGTTQKRGVLMAASIKWRTNIEWVPVGDGNIYPTVYKLGRPEIAFSLTYELEQDGSTSLVAAERDRCDAKDWRLFRLKLPGTGNNAIEIDWAGKYDTVGPYTKEGENNTTVTFDGRAGYSTTDAKWFGVKHTSDLATIP